MPSIEQEEDLFIHQLGVLAVQILRDTLKLGCSREHEARRTANMLQSTQACEAAEVECESVLEREQSGTLPSTGRAKAPDIWHMHQEGPLEQACQQHVKEALAQVPSCWFYAFKVPLHMSASRSLAKSMVNL